MRDAGDSVLHVKTAGDGDKTVSLIGVSGGGGSPQCAELVSSVGGKSLQCVEVKLMETLFSYAGF